MQRTDQTHSLGLDDFSFHGFAELLPTVEQILAQLTIRTGQRTVNVVENAVFVPAAAITPVYHEGALLTADGQPVPTSLQQNNASRTGSVLLGRLSQPVPIKPERVVEEEVVYLGWHYHHFGHFLLETLARTWFLSQVDPSVKVVFHFQPPYKPTGEYLPMLAAFGIGQDRILTPETQTQFRRVIVPEPLYEMAHAAHVLMPEPFQAVARRIVGADHQMDQPLYLSRRLLPPGLRPLVGERDLEEILRENGFLVAYPERMSFADQIRLINRHRDIFTNAGTAVYLSFFALNPVRLHMLTDGVPSPDYFLAPSLVNAETTYCSCLVGGHTIATSYLPVMIQFDKLTSYLDARAMLKRRVRASLAPTTRDMADDYEELLFIHHLRHTLADEELPPDIESAAVARSTRSWPLSGALARYYTIRDPERVPPLVEQFSTLLGQESDRDRLAYYYEDVLSLRRVIRKHFSPDKFEKLNHVLLSVYGGTLIERDDEMRASRRAERKRARAEARAALRIGGKNASGPSPA